MNYLNLSDVCNLTSKTEEELLSDHIFPEPLSNGLYTEHSINRYLKTRNSDVLTMDDVTSRLRVKPNKVYQLIREGKLSCVVKGKPRTGIYEYSVIEYQKTKNSLEHSSYPSRYELNKSYEKFYQEILKRHSDKKFCFITLTLRKVLETEHGRMYNNREEVEKYLRRFMSEMNRFGYGRQGRSRGNKIGTRLVSLSSVETDFVSNVCENIRDRFHCHILLEIPKMYQERIYGMFIPRILKVYDKLKWSYNEYDIQIVDETPEKVVDYVTKGGDGTVLLDTSYF